MTPKELHDTEQGLTIFSETMPPFLFRLYKNLMAEGFTEQQAFVFIIEYSKIMFNGAK